MEEQAIKKGRKTNTEQFNFTDDRIGLHLKHYHNQAKIYQSERSELSYREALNFLYKNNKKIDIAI